jgi:hypothetical protein
MIPNDRADTVQFSAPFNRLGRGLDADDQALAKNA